MEDNFDSYSWQDFSTNSSYLVEEEGTYYCTVTYLDTTVNLITNGDFEQGNTGFTSDYTYYPIADVSGPQGSYGILNNSNTWFNPFGPCTDHTSGSGNMYIGDGSAANGGTDAIWCQTVSVQPNTDYMFSYWIQNVVDITPLHKLM